MKKYAIVERIDIERALDDIVSNEEGMRFQNLAVVLAKQRWPELIACERHNDLGLDAYAQPLLAGDGIGKGLACSTSGKFTKLNSDAKTAKKNYSALSVLMFATLAKVTQHMEDQWRKKIRSTHGMELVVLSPRTRARDSSCSASSIRRLRTGWRHRATG